MSIDALNIVPGTEAAVLADLAHLRARDQWHEDDGPVLWWWPPIEGPPYVGTPLDDDWPAYEPTHWTPLLVPGDKPAEPPLLFGDEDSSVPAPPPAGPTPLAED